MNTNLFGEFEMNLADFQKFCRCSNIVLRDAYNGRVYHKLKNYKDAPIFGFYVKLDGIGPLDDYNPCIRPVVVGWVSHSYFENKKEEKK